MGVVRVSDRLPPKDPSHTGTDLERTSLPGTFDIVFLVGQRTEHRLSV